MPLEAYISIANVFYYDEVAKESIICYSLSQDVPKVRVID